jgi:hypothetical protein
MDILDEDKYFQLEVAEDINSSIDDLIKLSSYCSNYKARKLARFTIKRIANSPNREHIFDGNFELKDYLVSTCYDSDLLAIFAEDPDREIRWSVAMESDTPTEILDKLSHDSYHMIRNSVAENSNTSDYTLARLSNDENNFVRLGVAQNPKTPYAILLKLSKDESPDVRTSAMENKNFQEQR